MKIGNREIGFNNPPLVIAEIGINHGGDFGRALQMVIDAGLAGAECVKFQYHLPDIEMSPAARDVVPPNAEESIYDIIKCCTLTDENHRTLKAVAEEYGMIYLATPFCKEAVDKLEAMEVQAYKIGSGECNNYPLVEYIASKGKPVILSTGMNDTESISTAMEILEDSENPHAVLHCTSMYPTPYEKIRLSRLVTLREMFPNAVLGLSDHSVDNYACFAAVAFGARILEKHFTSSKSWEGPDIDVSIDQYELRDLVKGTRAVFLSLIGTQDVVPEEEDVAKFAYASVWATKPIEAGDELTEKNISSQRPGTGEIPAAYFNALLGRKARYRITPGEPLRWTDIDEQ